MGDWSVNWRQERRRRGRRKKKASAESAIASLKLSLRTGDSKSRWLSSDEASMKAGSAASAAQCLSLPRRQNSKINLRELLVTDRASNSMQPTVSISNASFPLVRNESFRLEELVTLRPIPAPFDDASSSPVQQSPRLPRRTRSSDHGSQFFCPELQEESSTSPIKLQLALPQFERQESEVKSAGMLPEVPLRQDSIMDLNFEP